MSSIDEARAAQISWDEWCLRVSKGGYRYTTTHWYRAGRALEQEAKAPPPPPPTSGAGKRCVYFSNVTDEACAAFAALGPGYTALLTADPNPAYHCSNAQLATLKSGGGKVASWCDCSSTPYSAAVAMAQSRGLAFAGGQAEDEDQYLQAIDQGCTHIIGNPANLGNSLHDAIDRAGEGSLAFIGEVLSPDPTYSAQGVNISSACLYIDRDAAQGGYIPLSAYSAMPANLRQGASLYTGGRATPADWSTYAAWTKP